MLRERQSLAYEIEKNRKANLSINVRKFLVSPYGPTLFPLVLLIISFLFPPSIYSYYVQEPDYMFLNMKMFSFAALCFCLYYMGSSIPSLRFCPRIKLNNKKIVISPLVYIGTIAIITIVLQVLFVFVYYHYFFKVVGLNVFLVSLTGMGSLIKAYSHELHIPFGLGGIPNIIIWFGFWLIYMMYRFPKKQRRKLEYKILKTLIYFSILLFLIEETLLVDRTHLFIFILGWVMIFIYFNKTKVYSAMLKVLFIIVLLFAITSILRWSHGTESISNLITGKFLGYTIANFNRLALILNDKLSYVAAGVPKSFYILPILKIPLTHIVFYGPKDYSSISLQAAESAGLNSSYNSATLFGGIYQSVGIATFIYFSFLGFLGRKIYNLFIKAKISGIVLYPLFYTSVALWIGDVNDFFIFFLYAMYAIFILAIYNFIFKPRIKNV